MPDEKLELSIEDLGRFAAFMDGETRRPMEVLRDWIHIYSVDENEAESAVVRLQQGYHEEQDYIFGDGPLKHHPAAKNSFVGKIRRLWRKNR